MGSSHGDSTTRVVLQPSQLIVVVIVVATGNDFTYDPGKKRTGEDECSFIRISSRPDKARWLYQNYPNTLSNTCMSSNKP